MAEARREEPELGLRERKKRQTRLDLCMAARRLAAEHGLDATTTDEIAKAVGVSPRTFFNYYETKLDAVVGPVGEIGTPEARLEFAAGGPTGVLIDDVIRLYVSGYEPEDEVRESIALVASIIETEPRVLAGFIAAGAQHEDALRELLSARLGDTVSAEFAGLTAGLMSTLATRAATSLRENPSRSLADAVRAQCAMAIELFSGSQSVRKPDNR
ncbi:mycofactocin system transcriptional regulator [Nocardia otitidiscaviarum]|uniref:Mycofactocin system transcriptional regulator n=1 Tax=Nocardia otitidiscaviarum TaxID=1823 RepID=A0A378YKK4_9NOCA|nr:TetR/AcrR family transcriptional regulator [Nocardia otitidiscaviarum]MCP9620522.1 TetR/AcrR family transcriptional regulator [Nocardia otitidiscaviarum]QDP81348.1 TetR/AcrR family transcriptional regulator [Nocardia otitidiscaviarum]SUA77696.1 mycofactocin system transcriptional regulator [Nocardia otitidiscaviarum]